MVIIFNDGKFWIEQIISTRNPGPGSNQNIDISLEKPGRFVGCSVAFIGDSLANGLNHVCTITANGTDATITYGLALTQIRAKVQNNAGAGQPTVTFCILLFMRE